MTVKEFNAKWFKYLEKDFYGLDIDEPEVIEYLDKEFEKEVKVNPAFKFLQIKLKCNTCRVYAKTDKKDEWEDTIDEMLGFESDKIR